MSKPKPITCKSIAVFKVDDLLTLAVELEIIDGKVVSIKNVSRAPNVPASTIGAGNKNLWDQARSQLKPANLDDLVEVAPHE